MLKMSENSKKIAAIRIKGLVNVKKTVEDTLKILRLYRKNYCVVLEKKPEIIGMLKKIKDCITWGEIDDSTLKFLVEKRGEKDKKFFRLHPPRKGFGRKGTKKPFSVGGALGYRGEKINELIKRMV